MKILSIIILVILSISGYLLSFIDSLVGKPITIKEIFKAIGLLLTLILEGDLIV